MTALATDTDVVVVLTTLPAGETDEPARVFARTLVDERLAACVSVQAPMTSVYRWKGAVDAEAERQLVIKTTRARLAALEARLRTLHPYDVPELIVLAAAGGGAQYLGWVVEETAPGGTA